MPKKEVPAPAAEAVAGPSVAKDEPKAPEDPAVDSKPVSGPSEVMENSPVLPKRLEKRNSIHLFFKNLVGRICNPSQSNLQPLDGLGNSYDCELYFTMKCH